jgi:hypothetical protein
MCPSRYGLASSSFFAFWERAIYQLFCRLERNIRLKDATALTEVAESNPAPKTDALQELQIQTIL